MAKRQIMRVELSAAAKRKIEQVHVHHGMTQVATMSRLVDWFADQDAMMQSAVLGRFPLEEKPDTAKMVLERMARRDGLAGTILSLEMMSR